MLITLPLFLWRNGVPTPQHFAWLAFLAYACLGFAWAQNSHTSVLGLWTAFIWALSFWLGSTLSSLTQLWRGLALGLSISSGVAIAQALDYTPVEVATDQYAGLLFSGTVQGASIALVLIALWCHRQWWYMPPLVIGLILSQSRGAFLILGLFAIARYTHWLLSAAILIVSRPSPSPPSSTPLTPNAFNSGA